MSDLVLVLNSGSSSIKYQLLHADSGEVVASGLAEKIGEAHGGRIAHESGGRELVHDGPIADHRDGLRQAFEMFRETGIDLTTVGVGAVGHRVVHGGEVFWEPTIVTDDVLTTIRDLSELAPLHNPANAVGIESTRELLPGIPQVAVFDTAFFHGLPDAAKTYAIDAKVAAAHGIRKYGFHGTSHQYVSEKAAEFLGRDYRELNQVVFHLGNGASASAIRGGVAVDTTMGMTPLEGLVMGTRPGDLDPGIVPHLVRVADLDLTQVEQLLNRDSGLKGMSGVNDFRELSQLVEKGDAAAKLAYDVYIHRLRRYLGAYLVELGSVDVIVFTAGVGENAANVRADALAGLTGLGIEVDPGRNETRTPGVRRISPEFSPVEVLVVPTNEELAIARAAHALTR
ncbi:acetate kinase [Nocardia caishijiensis]|uniref:Acetate kinase n=1 Tax=Nocardia caishijiensis TaxID=184756 RepID=A0ABQ6YUC7_9NOCA|nr:acetate kinase [Nocardia caishijiensis]KAF0849154.1 acetate kinase [Nocardia caishijiensis]